MKKGVEFCPPGTTPRAALRCPEVGGGVLNPGANDFAGFNFQGCPSNCHPDAQHVSWAAICCN